MKVIIEFSADNASFDDDFRWELLQVTRQIYDKVMAQLNRPPALCQHPESSDKILDTNGNTIGSIKLTEDI